MRTPADRHARDRALARRIEQRRDPRTRLAWSGREDRQLAAFGGIPAARHRRIQQYRVRTLSAAIGHIFLYNTSKR